MIDEAEAKGSDTSTYFKTLSILHLAMLIGQLLFGGVAAALVLSGSYQPSLPDSRLIQIAAIAVAVVGVGLSQFLFNSRMAIAHTGANLDAKLSSYKTAAIVRNALLEGPALFCITLYLLTGKLLYIGIAAVLILWFAFQFPVRSKVLSALQMDELSLAEEGTDRF